MAHVDANFGYAVAIGGKTGYPHDGIPDAALIGADGKVAFIGHPADISNNTIKRLLDKVRKPKPEEQQSRAAAMVTSAEALVADKQLLRAEQILLKTAAKFGSTESGKKAAARAKELSAGEFKAEYDAQKELARLVTGIEKPAAAFDPKTTEALVKSLQARAADWKDAAPTAARLASEWADIAANPWK
jgi:hypothetical protein